MPEGRRECETVGSGHGGAAGEGLLEEATERRDGQPASAGITQR